MESWAQQSRIPCASLVASAVMILSIIGGGAAPGFADTDGDAPEAAVSAEARRIAELEAALATTAAERAGLRRGISALRNEIYELLLASDRVKASDAARAESESKSKELLSEAEAELRQAVGNLEVLRRENERLLAQSEAERAEFEQGISAVRVELDQLRTANERLESESEVRGTSDSEAGRRIESLEEMLASTEAERSRLEQTTLELRGEVEELREMNEWLAVAAAERSDAESVEPEQPVLAVNAELTESVEFSQSASLQLPPGKASFAAASPLAREATTMVEGWSRAWSEQRIEDYLSFYSRSFHPMAGLSLGEWESQRRERVSGPDWIEVLFAMAGLQELDKDRIEVVFLQSYSSNLMADVVVKTLKLVREDGDWKIAAEQTSSPWAS